MIGTKRWDPPVDPKPQVLLGLALGTAIAVVVRRWG